MQLDLFLSSELPPKPAADIGPRLRPYQQEAVAGVFKCLKEFRSTLAVLPTGCHRAGQQIMMLDGTTKAVEDIDCGDRLMGPDSKSRSVLQLARGVGRMVEIIPIKGRPFVVNDEHILTLVKTNEGKGYDAGQVVDVSVSDYLKWSKSKKRLYKLFRVGVDFNCWLPTTLFDNVGDLPIDPYFLGLLLGDGGLKYGAVGITTADHEIRAAIHREADNWRVGVRYENAGGKSLTLQLHTTQGRRTELRRCLYELGVMFKGSDTKFIPHQYKTATRQQRLELLAGLMDTDGSKTTGGYDYISKSQQLSENVVFVARSLGMAAYMSPCVKSCQTGAVGTYYRVSISGDCDAIPCRIERKKSPPRKQKKNVLRTGFSVRMLGTESYYGFRLTGDGRYLLDDFTVTHNTGKTVLFSEIVRQWPGRTMILAHRRELLDQAQNKLQDATGEYAALEQGENRAFSHSRIIVASKDSLHASRIRKFTNVSLLIIDEAHRATENNKSYSNVIKYLREDNPNLKVLGVTATPKRHDGEAMGQLFESVAYQYEIHEAIDDGWLVPMGCRSVAIEGLDLTGVRTTAGDLNGKDLAEVLERDKVLLAYADAIVRESEGRNHVLVFCSSVAQSQALASLIDHHNKGRCEFVCGDPNLTPPNKRVMVSRDFRDGHIRFLVNCGVYLEGFDAPLTDMIVMARPTKSHSLYCQMLGRGSRPAPGVVDGYESAEERKAAIAASIKPDCVVLDFVGNASRHKLVSIADVLGGKYTDEVRELAMWHVRKKGGAANIDEELEKAEKAIEKRKQDAARRKAKITARANYKSENVDLFDPYTQTEMYSPEKKRGPVMPFGKHKGEPLERLHTWYLSRLWEKCPITKDWLKTAICSELSKRRVRIPIGVNSRVKKASEIEEAPF